MYSVCRDRFHSKLDSSSCSGIWAIPRDMTEKHTISLASLEDKMVSSSLFRSAGIACAFLRLRTISTDVTLLKRQFSPECAISGVTYGARAIVALGSPCAITRQVPYFATGVAVHMIPSQHLISLQRLFIPCLLIAASSTSASASTSTASSPAASPAVAASASASASAFRA